MRYTRTTCPATHAGRSQYKAREAVFFSRHEAGQLGSRTIEPEHVLLGLIRASEGLKGRIFELPALGLNHARIELISGRPITDPLPPPVPMSTGDRAQQIFRAAAEEADALKHHEIGLASLLLGVLREPGSEATTLLDRTGIRLQSVRDGIAVLLNEEPL